MAIEGPLRELSIHDVFQLLDLSRKTGTLTVTSPLRDNQGVVYFDRGGVIFAHIKSNPHPLGELLLRAGKITEGDLTRLREQQRREGNTRKLGELLVEAGALSRKELERQVRFQVEEVVFEMMSWREGFFSFEEGQVLDAPTEADIRISTEALLMEAARRIDEWSLIVGKVPNVAVVPVLAGADGEHAGLLDLLPKEWEVLTQIDGARSLRAIASASAMSEFDIARVMYGLLTTGIVELRPGDGALTPSEAVAVLPDVMPAPPAVAAPAASAASAVTAPFPIPGPRRSQPATSAIDASDDQPSDAAEAVILPGSLLHIPSLERTAMHRVSGPAMPPPEIDPTEELVPEPLRAPPRPSPVRGTPPGSATWTSDDAVSHLERARTALREGDIGAAVTAAAAAVDASGGSVEARIVLTRAQLKAGRVDDAIASARLALKSDALNPSLYLLLGACAAARGALADAVSSWERYVRLAPDAADAPRVRAVAEAARRLREALRELGDV